MHKKIYFIIKWEKTNASLRKIRFPSMKHFKYFVFQYYKKTFWFLWYSFSDDVSGINSLCIPSIVFQKFMQTFEINIFHILKVVSNNGKICCNNFFQWSVSSLWFFVYLSAQIYRKEKCQWGFYHTILG